MVPVIAAAAAGRHGDHVSYALGRAARSHLVGGQRSRRQSAMAWARRVLAQRGGLVIVVARYIPGGRVAATMTAGSVGYPLRRFTPFAVIAGLSWGAYSALVGFLGGSAFEDDPVRALLLGFSLAMGAALLVEVTRHLVRRRSPSTPSSATGWRPVATTDQTADVTPTGAPLSESPSPPGVPRIRRPRRPRPMRRQLRHRRARAPCPSRGPGGPDPRASRCTSPLGWATSVSAVIAGPDQATRCWPQVDLPAASATDGSARSRSARPARRSRPDR